MAVTISVIISTNARRPEHLQRAVESLLRQTRLPDELIIVNDGEDDVDPRLAVQAVGAGVKTTYRLMAKPGLTASRNAGVALARGDIVLLLDDDVLAGREFIQRLVSLYEVDRGCRVAGIGANLVPPGQRWTNRLWAALAGVLAENRWGPRRCAARYVPLRAALAGHLSPAWRLSGGGISLRADVARRFPFSESFNGYCLGEDTELSFRLTQQQAIYTAGSLELLHDTSGDGRPDLGRRGRMYAANMLTIYRNSTERGAGTAMLLGYHLAGMICLAGGWGLLTAGAGNVRMAGGIAGELGRQAWAWCRGLVCGR